MRSIPVRSMQTPPCTAATWASSEVPAPKGTTGTRCAAHVRTMALTSSVDRGKHTASGGHVSWFDSPWPCWSRTAAAVESRSPTSERSSARTSSRALVGVTVIGTSHGWSGRPYGLAGRRARDERRRV